MSYDIDLTIDAGGPEPINLGFYWNYTSNCVPMWRRAMPVTDGLAGMDGMQAGEAAAILAAGISAMKAYPDEYRALNPENGWGDFEGQLAELERLLAECRRAPRARIEVSR